MRRIAPLVLLRGYEDFNRGSGIPRANFLDDFQLFQAAELLGTVGTFYGPPAIDQVIAELLDAFEDVRFAPETAKWIDVNRLFVLVGFAAKGRGSGVQVDRFIAHLWTLGEGFRVARLEVYWDPAEALEAEGLSE